MTLDDIRAYVNRDWGMVEELGRESWQLRSQLLGPAEAIRLAHLLREHVRAVRPDWPSEADRGEDLAAHIRFVEILKRINAALAV